MSDEMRDLLVRMDEKLERLEADVGQLKHLMIEGNGSPPFTVRLALADSRLDRLEEERTDKKIPRSAWVAIVVSTIISLASMAMGAM